MTTTDWLQVDSHILTMTNSESAPDLFGGDLFGDELMDMYNSDAVVGGSVDDSGGEFCNCKVAFRGFVLASLPSLVEMSHNTDMAGTCVASISLWKSILICMYLNPLFQCSDIPTLLLSGSHAEHTPNKIDVHVSAEIAMIAAAMDDGLGAFRPSTSFNDFSSLLTSGPAVVESSGTVVAAIAESCQAVNQEVDRKRSIADDDKAGPETKKRDIICKPSSPRRQNTPKPITVISGISTAATHTSLQVKKEQHTLLQNRGEKENTPNPLSLSVSVPAASLVPRKSDPVKYVAPGSVGTTPAVVSPRIVATVSTSESFPPDTSAAISAAGVPQNQSPSAATEADFIAVAQAAVSNLILNAGSEAPPRVDATKKCVDVSTAHIKALTSTNWVTACSGSDGSAENDVTTDSKANRARRQNLNPDERARQNRDRNREHARNTRLRKKAYVEELKRTLTELVAQRDSAEVEKRHSIQRELEQREVRFRVMEELLNLRGRNEPNFTRWIAILEEEFSLTLPFTTFREMAESKCKSMTTNVKKIEQAFTGAAEVMEDSRSIAAFLQTLGNENTTDASSSPITLLYHCDRKNFFMDGCSGVLVWSATSVGAVNNVSF